MASINSQVFQTTQANAGVRVPVGPDPMERHFTPQELAVCWGLDVSTVRRMFQDELGVLKVGKASRRDGKRDYVTLRIPQSVVQRVYREKVKRT